MANQLKKVLSFFKSLRRNVIKLLIIIYYIYTAPFPADTKRKKQTNKQINKQTKQKPYNNKNEMQKN